jgi:hypothetical protein
MQHLSETIRRGHRLCREFDRKRALQALTRAFIENNVTQVEIWFKVHQQAVKRLSECDAP